jgi:hypothetical protein
MTSSTFVSINFNNCHQQPTYSMMESLETFGSYPLLTVKLKMKAKGAHLQLLPSQLFKRDIAHEVAFTVSFMGIA